MKFLFGCIFFVLFFLLPLFHPGVPVSHDGENHLARFAAYYQAFQDGHFPARWAGTLNFGYGIPVLMFFYPLPGYLAGLLHSVGFSFESSFKLLLGASFITAFVTFYFWMRMLFNNKVAILGAFLYGLTPYHFLNLYVRGDIGELLAYAFIPLVFWAIENVRQRKKMLYAVLGGIFYGLLILSHNGVSLMFSPVIALYILVLIWQSDNKKFLIVNFSFLIFLGLALSAFFWIPALYEGRYVNAHLFIGSMYKDHFPTFLQLLISSWGFGSDVTKPGGLSPQIGLVYILFVIASIVVWFNSKKEKKLHGAWIIVFILAVFITLPLSSFIWDNLSILRLYEFPWRFVGLASFAAVVLSSFVISKLHDKKLFGIIGVVLFVTSIPFAHVQEYIFRDDTYYSSFPGTTYYHGEATTIWTAGEASNFPKQPVELIGGKAEITDIIRKSHKHTFMVDAQTPVQILDNTVYFPGWEVLSDGQSVPIQFQDPNHRGLITFQLPSGKHKVEVRFTETKVRLAADMISLGALLVVLIFFSKPLLYTKIVKHT